MSGEGSRKEPLKRQSSSQAASRLSYMGSFVLKSTAGADRPHPSQTIASKLDAVASQPDEKHHIRPSSASGRFVIDPESSNELLLPALPVSESPVIATAAAAAKAETAEVPSALEAHDAGVTVTDEELIDPKGVSGQVEPLEEELCHGSTGMVGNGLTSSSSKKVPIVSAFKPAKYQKATIQDRQVLRDLALLRNKLTDQQRLAEAAKKELDVAEATLRSIRNDMQQREQSNAHQQPRNVGGSGLRLNERKEGTALERMHRQEMAVEALWRKLTTLENDRDRTDLQIHRLLPLAGQCDQRVVEEAARDMHVGSQLRRTEHARASKAVRKAATQAAAAAATSDTSVVLGDDSVSRLPSGSVNQDAQKESTKALPMTSAARRQRKVIAQEGARTGIAEEKLFDERAQRMTNLRASINKAKSAMVAANEKKRIQREREERRRQDEKRELLGSGLNPYEVWRRRDVEVAIREQQERSGALKKQRGEKLLQQLLYEEECLRHQEAKDKKEQDMQDEFQRVMSSAADKDKFAKYISSVAIGGAEIVDPTGTALRIDPSCVTVQKTAALGTGRASSAVIDKTEAECQAREARLLARLKTAPDDDDADHYDYAAGMGGPVGRASAALAESTAYSGGMTGMGVTGIGGQAGEEAQDAADMAAELEEEEDRIRAGRVGSTPYHTQCLLSGAAMAPAASIEEVRELSALEKTYQARALERQRAGICQPQRCWGREFKGEAFLSKPAVIRFADFDVGKSYRIAVQVTNVSFTFNNFRLLPLDPAIADFFDLDFQPPGRMSAGTSTRVGVTFRPKVNKDISTTLPILAQTGRIDFPLEAVTKKTILTYSPTGLVPPVIPEDSPLLQPKTLFDDSDAGPPPAEVLPVVDIGKVTRGEAATSQLYIRNDGALPARFAIIAPAVEGYDMEDPNFDAADPEYQIRLKAKYPLLHYLVWKQQQQNAPTKQASDAGSQEKLPLPKQRPGWLENHCTTTVDFTFAPTELGVYEIRLPLIIDNPLVVVRCECVDVPIFVEREEYDLKMILLGHCFREVLTFWNRSAITMKVSIVEPSSSSGAAYREELSCNPSMAYVQGNMGSQKVALTFKPRPDFFERHPEFIDNARQAEEPHPHARIHFKIPVKLLGADQAG